MNSGSTHTDRPSRHEGPSRPPFRLLAWLLAALAFPAAAQERPNILMVLVDDLGRQDVAAYGSTLYQTPNLDRLAREGVRFDNAYSAHPRCVPSRVGLLSGHYPARFGIPGFLDREQTKHALPLQATTFAEALRQVGYRTGYIGKWHVGKEGGGPAEQGFETSILAGPPGAPPSHFWPYEKRNGETRDFIPYEGGGPGEYLTDRLTDEALGFIDAHHEEPFLLVLAHYAVHTPIEAPEHDVERYRERMAELGIEPAGPRWDRDVVVDGTGEVKTVQNNPVYAGMVDAVDRGVGRLLDRLDALGISERTLVLVTSDHGGLSSRGLGNKRPLATSNLPYRHGKGWLYEGGIRVPLIARWPGRVPAGQVSPAQVTGTDHFPTLLEAAGVGLKPELHPDGESYLAALERGDRARGPMYWHSSLGRPKQTGDTRASAVVDGRWKLIEWYSLEDETVARVELFDLENDPGEQHDLAEREPAETARLRGLLDAWKDSVNARLGEFKPGGV